MYKADKPVTGPPIPFGLYYIYVGVAIGRAVRRGVLCRLLLIYFLVFGLLYARMRLCNHSIACKGAWLWCYPFPAITTHSLY